MADYRCGACGARVTGDSLVCPACGHAAGTRCANCGFVSATLVFAGQACPNCGSTAHLPRRHQGEWSGVLKAAAFIIVVVAVGTAIAFMLGEFRSPAVITGPLVQARSGHTATLLPNGRVLLAGGSGVSGPLASTEIYDPATGRFTAGAAMGTARSGQSAVTLHGGKVLMVAGQGASGPLASAEIYDPSRDAFTPTGSLATARVGQVAAPLPDGRVLVAGGQDGTGPLASAEVYDPSTGRFSVN